MGRTKRTRAWLFKRDRFPAARIIQDIIALFIKPLMQHRPDGMDPEVFLGEIFHLRERDIIRYKTTKGFKIPGLLKLTANVKIQGVGNRKVRKGAVLWVRTDSTRPGVVEVETFVGRGKETLWFEMTDVEWIRIRQNVRRIDPLEGIDVGAAE